MEVNTMKSTEIFLILVGLFTNITRIYTCTFGENCDYPCHCQDNEVCNPTNGSCPSGCDDGDLRGPGDYDYTGAWSGYGCQIGNVAYNKFAEQAKNSSRPPTSYYAERAGLAVDGNQDPYVFKCAHTFPGNGYDNWWRVDLGATYVVQSINITNVRPDNCCQSRLKYLHIYVTEGLDEELPDIICYTIREDGEVDALYINCTRPMIGRYVTLQQHTNYSSILNICEVQVYGYLYRDCPDDYFGVACGMGCNCQVSCDDITGECPDQNCLDGWMDTDCQRGCTPGTWGQRCLQQCSCQDEQEICDRFNGTCMTGCPVGYGGIGCNLVLPSLLSEVQFSSASLNSLRVTFETWTPTIPNEAATIAYQIQWRSNDSRDWLRSLETKHRDTKHIYIISIDNLEPGTLYLIKVVPFIDDGGVRYYGVPTPQYGPFSTLNYVTGNADATPVIAGVVLVVTFAAIVAIVVAILFKRHRKRNKDDNVDPLYMDDMGPISMEDKDIDSGYEVPNIGADNHQKKNQVYVNDAMIRNKQTEDQYEAIVQHHGMQKDESTPRLSLPEESVNQKNGPLENPIQLHELASYITEMTMNKDAFKEEFDKTRSCLELHHYESLPGDRFSLSPDVLVEVHPEGKANGKYAQIYTKEEPTGYIVAEGLTSPAELLDLIWQKGSNRIVLFTDTSEKHVSAWKVLSPSRGTTTVGTFRLSMINETTFADYSTKLLSLTSLGGVSRSVYLLHFTGWPTDQVPEVTASVLDFRRRIRSYDNIATGTLIVLSSTCDGRAGTFTALDYLCNRAKSQPTVDLMNYVSEIHNDGIKTHEQYEFVYRALLDAYQTEDTVIPAKELGIRYPELKKLSAGTGRSIIAENFALLELTKQQKSHPVEDAMNSTKNRDQMIIPGDKFRPFLHSPVRGTNDYINAVCVDSYYHRRAYMATQLPLPQTIVDFWRLVYEYNCSCVITLEQPEHDDVITPVYWPINKNKPTVLEQLTVTLLKQEEIEEGGLNMVELEIVFDKGISRTVRMYHWSEWSQRTEIPMSLENTLKLLDRTHCRQQGTESSPIIFQCKYGYKRCGLMIAACYMLEKLREDRQVDVFQAVRKVRIPRPEFITSLAQYEFLHELALAYIDSSEDYSNFK